MKPSKRQRQQRAARKQARRNRRLATGRRPRRFSIDVDSAEANIEMLMRPIRAQSKPRQKKLDAEAKAKRKGRRAWQGERWTPPPRAARRPMGRCGKGGYAPVQPR